MSTTSDRESVRPGFSQFLLAEYDHATEALLRNEESGEKRATFFLSVAGATAGILAFVFGGENSLVSRALVPRWAAGSAAFLLIFGLLTVRRLIERHIVTDRHIFALRNLRRAFVTREDARAFPNAFFKLYEPFERRQVSVLSVGKGGWLETLALINASMAGCAAAAVARAIRPTWPWLWPALVAFAAAWLVQILYARQRLTTNTDELIAREQSAADN